MYLPDFSYLHVVQWHFNDVLDDNLLPICNSESFFKCKDKALDFAFKLGNFLLDYSGKLNNHSFEYANEN